MFPSSPPVAMRPQLYALLVSLIASAFLSGCQTASQGRISQNPDLYQKLSASDRERVSNGEVREGMSKDAVFLAWGRPDMVRAGSSGGRGTESWAYFVSRPVPSSSLNYADPYRTFYGRFGVHPRFGYCRGPGWTYNSVDYVRYITKTVKFSGNRVIAWESVR